MDILTALEDLHYQATHERTHYYVAKVVRTAADEIRGLRIANGQLEIRIGNLLAKQQSQKT